MDNVDQLVASIHAAPARLVIAVTGGGSGAISQLLRVPGGSKTLLEAVVPYSSSSLARFLGVEPEQSCSERTARSMAMTAFCRAVELADGAGDDLLGIACTASLASDREKRGAHRIHVALQTSRFTETASLELSKGRRGRVEEEGVATRLILTRLAAASGIDSHVDLKLFDEEQVSLTRTDADEDRRELLLGDVDAVYVNGPAGQDDQLSTGVVFPGAFNPLHNGHQQMAEIAAQKLGTNVEFEISIENVDKPTLDYTEIANRISQFNQGQSLWLTRAATFVEKSMIFPGCTFIVGADTIIRIADPAYYNNNVEKCQTAIEQIASQNCRFLIFGRIIKSEFATVKNVDLPTALLDLCTEIPEDEFRDDVSSTSLRKSHAFNE